MFNRWGCLKAELYQHSVKKGTGAWGPELDQGRLLLIETVRINEGYRRQGHGRALVDQVWEKACSAHPDLQYAFAWPICPNDDDIAEKMKGMAPGESRLLYQELCLAAQDFFKALGFRRIGSSRWYARTDDPAHPSRSLAPSDDYKRPTALDLVPYQEGQKYPYDAGMVKGEDE